MIVYMYNVHVRQYIHIHTYMYICKCMYVEVTRQLHVRENVFLGVYACVHVYCSPSHNARVRNNLAVSWLHKLYTASIGHFWHVSERPIEIPRTCTVQFSSDPAVCSSVNAMALWSTDDIFKVPQRRRFPLLMRHKNLETPRVFEQQGNAVPQILSSATHNKSEYSV